MNTYYPFLRGRQNELLALKLAAGMIADSASVCPIIEPVNDNPTTRNSLARFVEESMPFIFVTNPDEGAYKGNANDVLHTFFADNDAPLGEYQECVAAIHVYRETGKREVDWFRNNYGYLFLAVIYHGEPVSEAVREWCASDDKIYYHILMEGTVSSAFIETIPRARRITIRDFFKKEQRNADYVPSELFTDWNTREGNIGTGWGDYSIQGDYFSDSGGPAYAVAIHHVHKSENNGALYLNHFLSDRQQTTADAPGKAIEAVRKLVDNLPGMMPNDTYACREYRKMAGSGNWKGLGYFKRMAILQHLEIMLREHG